MDLDSYLQSEMEDLNDMFQEFETQDQQKKRRARDEEEKIMTKVLEMTSFWLGVGALCCATVTVPDSWQKLALSFSLISAV